MKKLKHNTSLLLVPFVAFLIRLIHKTIRWDKRIDYELYKGKIIALLHGNALGGITSTSKTSKGSRPSMGS